MIVSAETHTAAMSSAATLNALMIEREREKEREREDEKREAHGANAERDPLERAPCLRLSLSLPFQ